MYEERSRQGAGNPCYQYFDRICLVGEKESAPSVEPAMIVPVVVIDATSLCLSPASLLNSKDEKG